FGNSRIVEGVDGLTCQAVFSGNRVRDQRLNTGVAHILQPLPVRRVHVGVVGIEKRSSPANIPDRFQTFVVGIEMCADVKRECCKPGAQLFYLQCLVCGLDIDLKKSPGPPFQGREFAGMASARQKLVMNSVDVLSFNLISISFFAMLTDKRFRVSQANRGARSAADGELWVGSSQL